MSHEAREPVFGVLGITQAQTSLRICSVCMISTFNVIRFSESIIILNLLQVKFQFSRSVSVAEETGLKLALLETPTGFVKSMSIFCLHVLADALCPSQHFSSML